VAQRRTQGTADFVGDFRETQLAVVSQKQNSALEGRKFLHGGFEPFGFFLPIQRPKRFDLSVRWFVFFPIFAVERNFRPHFPPPVAEEPIGDFHQIRPGTSLVSITRTGLPRTTKDFLEQIVGGIRPASHAEQIPSDRAAVVAYPGGEPFGLRLQFVRSHAIEYKRKRGRIIAE
jgi:hypothetical protein